MALADSSPPTASDSHDCSEQETKGFLKHKYFDISRLCACARAYLIFGELPPQAPDVLGRLRDLRLQTGGVSHLRIPLVHALHLLQRVAGVKPGGEKVLLFWKCQALIEEASLYWPVNFFHIKRET